MDLNLLYIWMGTMICLIISVPLVRSQAYKNAPNVEQFVAAGFALGGGFSLFYALYNVAAQEELQYYLGWDGLIALSVGSGMGIYIAAREVIRLFD